MCCSECFQDAWLKDYITRQSSRAGACAHCGAREAQLIECSELSALFEDVLEAYSYRDSGKPLSALLQDDWMLFAIAPEHSDKLLSCILGAAAELRYEPKAILGAGSAVSSWAALRDELKYRNRFFPENAPDRQKFIYLMNNLEIDSLPQPLYRARVLKGEAGFSTADMGAPPAERVGDGRANPTGIPYLYLAGDVETAISEVRPAKHDRVAVAKFEIVGELKLIDLSNPRMTLSPFAIGAESIGEVRGSLDFLAVLAEELSTPTPPHRTSIDYLASQYLCELIKSIGYSGVVYTSAQTRGMNITLFDPAAARCQSVETYHVDSYSLAYTAV